MLDKAWYLVHTKPQREETALAHLDRQGYEAFLPRARRSIRHGGRWRQKVDALFPRYLFLHLDTEEQDWHPIHSTVGISRLVRFGTWPARVPEPLVEDLLGRADTDGIVLTDRSAEFEPGQTVRVTEGPLTGVEGIITAKTGRDRVDVLLAIVGQSTTARLPASYLATVTG